MVYRVNYRSLVDIWAENEEEAQLIFENMTNDELAEESEFVEMMSIEEA